MKILFLGSDSADYLNISILNGLISLQDISLFCYSAPNLLFKSNQSTYAASVRGGGFSIFFNHPDQTQFTEHYLHDKIQSNFFDVIIIGDIFSSYIFYPWVGSFASIYPNKIIVLDGADQENIFPFSGAILSNLYQSFFPRLHKKHHYFKRELTYRSIQSCFYMLIPRFIAKNLKFHNNLHPISFAFPSEKITHHKDLIKSKLYTKHVVDEGLIDFIPGAMSSYAFQNEAEYFHDIQISKFGITTKRSGWDCLRHYEIAANGAIICFKNLHLKPSSCAPHGLVAGVNCISYVDYNDLNTQITELNSNLYNAMLKKSYAWITSKTSEKLAREVIAVTTKS